MQCPSCIDQERVEVLHSTVRTSYQILGGRARRIASLPGQSWLFSVGECSSDLAAPWRASGAVILSSIRVEVWDPVIGTFSAQRDFLNQNLAGLGGGGGCPGIGRFTGASDGCSGVGTTALCDAWHWRVPQRWSGV